MASNEAFWQLILASDAPLAKQQQVARELAHRPDRLELVHRFPFWTDKERSRMGDSALNALERARDVNVHTTESWPEDFPPSDKPPAVFCLGDPGVLNAPTVAIVGTRSAGIYGKAVARKFSQIFAEAGAVVVSGGALGIDAAAHEGALQAGGKTVAVLAGGVDRVYPAQHAGLFQRIKEQGCLMSQFAVGSRPDAYKFLIRNRLVAGLCHALVLIEAPERSGAIVTATAAAEMGREVFVIPATIDNLGYRGSHALIRDGATLCDHPEQVLAALKLESKSNKAKPPTHDPIIAALGSESLTSDQLMTQTGIAANDLLARLSELELEGHIFRDGRLYRVMS